MRLHHHPRRINAGLFCFFPSTDILTSEDTNSAHLLRPCFCPSGSEVISPFLPFCEAPDSGSKVAPWLSNKATALDFPDPAALVKAVSSLLLLQLGSCRRICRIWALPTSATRFRSSSEKQPVSFDTSHCVVLGRPSGTERTTFCHNREFKYVSRSVVVE